MPFDPYQDGPAASDQQIRRWRLVLSGAGDSLAISESVNPLPNQPGIAGGDGFRMTFSTVQSRVQTPGSATITLYNTGLGAQINSLVQQYNRVTLFAGYYDGHFGVIFDGTLAYIERGIDDNIVDTFIKIFAIDGDWALNSTTTSRTDAAGTTEGEVAKSIVNDMATQGGARVGELNGLPQIKMPRAQVSFGMSTAALSKLNIQHYAENGQLNTFDPLRPGGNEGTATVLNSFTGLVGIPTVTQDGVEVVTLINSDYKLNSLVKIDQAAITRIATPFGQTDEGVLGIVRAPFAEGLTVTADVSSDGIYAIISKEFEGDTRGNVWYCRLVLFSANAVAVGALGPFTSPNVPGGNTPIDIGTGPTQEQIDNYRKDETAPAEQGNSGP